MIRELFGLDRDEREYVTSMHAKAETVTRYGSYCYVRGTIRNAGSEPVNFWRVLTVLQDRYPRNPFDFLPGEGSACAASVLQPGETAPFETIQAITRPPGKALVVVDRVRLMPPSKPGRKNPPE